MNITLIGAGNMGRGIGYRLMAGGHSVTLIDFNGEAANKLAAELQSVAQKGASVKVADLDTAKLDDVVFLALWYPINQQVVEQLGSRLTGKTVVDIANPLNSTYDGLAVPPDSSSPEELAKVAPAGTKMVKAFNTGFRWHTCRRERGRPEIGYHDCRRRLWAPNRPLRRSSLTAV